MHRNLRHRGGAGDLRERELAALAPHPDGTVRVNGWCSSSRRSNGPFDTLDWLLLRGSGHQVEAGLRQARSPPNWSTRRPDSAPASPPPAPAWPSPPAPTPPPPPGTSNNSQGQALAREVLDAATEAACSSPSSGHCRFAHSSSSGDTGPNPASSSLRSSPSRSCSLASFPGSTTA